MNIRITPQNELGSGRKRTADMILLLLLPRFESLYNRRVEYLRELIEDNPLGDCLRSAMLIAHTQEMMLYDHPLEMDLATHIKETSAQSKPSLDIHVLSRDRHWQKLLMTLIAELEPEVSDPTLAVTKNLEGASTQELEDMIGTLFASDFSSVSNDKVPFI